MIQKLCKHTASSLSGICHIVFPRVLLVFLDHCPEFQCHRLGNTIINIIKRKRINMVLSLPSFSFTVKWNLSVQFHPRHIDSQQFFPYSVPFLRCHIRSFKHNMLEMINHRSVRNECQCTGEMAVLEFTGILTKESVSPRPCEKFHRHRMYFTGFHSRPYLAVRYPVAIQPCGKCMSRLMCHDFHISLGTIKVRENKRNTVVSNACTVSSCFFTGR